MTELLTAVSIGAGNGSVYALLALGFVIIYKAMAVISFAQPAFMLSGAVLVSYLSPKVGFVAGVVLGTLAIAVVALVVERITIGVDIVVRVVAGAFVGINPRNIGDPWGLQVITIGGVQVQHRHLAAFLVAGVVVAALFAFFRFTRIGLAMRATALDQEAAMAQGVDVGRVFAVSWALAGGLAAIAGVFASAGNPIDQNLWIIALTALPVIILGGLDSLGGAVIAGLAIGVVEAVVSTYHSTWFPFLETNTGDIAPYPQGLFGTKEVERV